MARIIVENLVKRFAGGVTAVDEVSFTVEEGQILTLLGPSGCGKSTILRCIAGLERPTSGRITIGDEVVFDSEAGIDVAVNRRTIGMVFQSYAIWPHLNVFKNVELPLRLQRKGGKEAGDSRAAVAGVLESVGMEEYQTRFPAELSGGQQQRVVLARALVYRPKVLLLDEPLANLDAKLRETMRFEVREVQQRFGLTTLYVTHDQAEAMALSDQIFVMRQGVILRRGTPQEVFGDPRHPFVADFLGVSNIIGANVQAAQAGSVDLVIDGFQQAVRVPGSATVGERVNVGIRPTSVDLSTGAAGEQGVVRRASYLGEQLDCLVEIGGKELRVRVAGDAGLAEGSTVSVALKGSELKLLEHDVVSEEVLPSPA